MENFYTFNNKYRLRKEKSNVVLYRVNDVNGVESVKIIHPTHAIILSLFDGVKQTNAVLDICNYLFNAQLTQDTFFNKILNPYITEGILTAPEKLHLTSHKQLYDPVNFVIPNELVNLKEIRLSKPLEIVWHLTEDCFCNCIYCYNERSSLEQSKILDTSRLVNLAYEITEVGVNDVQFSGGDPLLHPLVFDILKILQTHNVNVYLSTKMPIDDIIADKLEESGIEIIQLSIDSLDSEKCISLNSYNDHGNKMLKAIATLKKRQIKVNTNTVVTKLNIDEITSLVLTFHNLGVNRISFAQYGRSLYNHQDFLFIEPEDKAKILEELEKFRSKDIPLFFSGMNDPSTITPNEKKEIFPNRARCGGLFFGCVIYPNGRLSICEQLPINSPFCWGDLKRQSLSDAWRDPDFFNILHPSFELFKSSPCYKCNDFEVCNSEIGRCIRNALQSFNDYWMPDPRCPKAPIGRRII